MEDVKKYLISVFRILKEEVEQIKKSCPAIALNYTFGRKREDFLQGEWFPAADCKNPQFEWVKVLKYGSKDPLENAYFVNAPLNYSVVSAHVSCIYNTVLSNLDVIENRCGRDVVEKILRINDHKFDPFTCYKNCKEFVIWVYEVERIVDGYLKKFSNEEDS